MGSLMGGAPHKLPGGAPMRSNPHLIISYSYPINISFISSNILPEGLSSNLQYLLRDYSHERGLFSIGWFIGGCRPGVAWRSKDGANILRWVGCEFDSAEGAVAKANMNRSCVVSIPCYQCHENALRTHSLG